MRAHQLKVNQTKSFFRVLTGKFFGFIVTSKEIHLDPDKINAIQSMQTLKSLEGLGAYKADLFISENSSQICRVNVNFSQG